MGGRKLDESVHREFRLSIKRRLYLKCVKVYPELFKNKDKGAARQKGLNEPYIWNDLLEEDQFARNTGGEQKMEVDQGSNPMDALTQEATKMQLETMFKEVVKDFNELRPKFMQMFKTK
jgi:hypothetical protein